MIILTKNYNDELRDNSLLLLSVTVVVIAMFILHQNSKDITISPAYIPQEKVKKSVISVMITQAKPRPSVKKKVQEVAKRVTKPVVKKKIIKKSLKKEQIVPKVLAHKEAVTTEEPIKEEVLEEEFVEVKQASAMPEKEVAVTQEQSPVFDAELKADYMAGLYKMLSQNKHYPKMAKRRHLEGTAYIHFKLLKNGKLEEIYLAQACGHKSLDRAALKLVRSIESYKPIPDEVSKIALNIKIPINYSLKEN